MVITMAKSYDLKPAPLNDEKAYAAGGASGLLLRLVLVYLHPGEDEVAGCLRGGHVVLVRLNEGQLVNCLGTQPVALFCLDGNMCTFQPF